MTFLFFLDIFSKSIAGEGPKGAKGKTGLLLVTNPIVP